MNKKTSFPAKDKNALSDCMAFIEASLRELRVDRKLMVNTLLVAEEMTVQLLEHSGSRGSLRVQVRRRLGDAAVTISALGEEFDPSGPDNDNVDLNEIRDEEAQDAIRSILLMARGESFRYSHKQGVNRVRIMLGQAGKTMMVSTVAALVLGLILGLLLKFVFSGTIANGIVNYLLDPVKTMYMNALKVMIAPVVFFSIVTCFSQFKNISELGRIGAKVMGMYVMTSILAVVLALAVFFILKPGAPGFALSQAAADAAVMVDTDTDTSVLHTIISIVPYNFLMPFLVSDTLQIIFLAVLVGVAVGMVGDHSSLLQEIFDALNSLFLTITAIITHLLPVAVFCSISIMIISMEEGTVLSVMSFAGTYVFAIICMMLVYGLLILVLGRLNPLTFYRKYREGMITSFMLSSSSAAMPINMKCCTEKLGISPKVSSFSIPLGSTVNMDGTCIILVIGGLFLARAYGIEVPAAMHLTLLITILLLSIGAPGVPGAGLVCLGIILETLGVPLEALGLVMGIYPFLDMFNSMSNTTGDVSVSLIVARGENLVDLAKYND